jgi:transcriptional regulator with XRE-family HTH domain
MSLSERIRQRMHDLGISSATELAMLANLDKASISRYLNERRQPGFEELKRLSTALKTTADWLMEKDTSITTKNYSRKELQNILNELDDNEINSILAYVKQFIASKTTPPRI